MALNKVKPGSNMYQFITHTWNPLAGECTHHCSYCSTHKMAKKYPEIGKKYSGPLHISEVCLKDKFDRDMFIFVCAQNDLFSYEVPGPVIMSILEHCRKYNARYLFQTKNPGRILDYLGWIPKNSVVCTTIETNRWYPEYMKDCPRPIHRAAEMGKLSKYFKTYVTIEPIMDFDLQSMVGLIKNCHPEQVNIGADSGKNNLPEPTTENLWLLIEQLKQFTVIDKKINLTRLFNGK